MSAREEFLALILCACLKMNFTEESGGEEEGGGATGRGKTEGRT